MKPLEAKRNESTKRNGEESNLFKFNGYDHRAGTINLNIEKDAQVRLRVHRFASPRFRHSGNLFCFRKIFLFKASITF